MSGCISGVRPSSPYLALNSAWVRSMVGVSSQWVMIGVGASRKMPSRVTGSSTSMLPVEAPMNTLIPGADFGSRLRTAARLSLLAPR